MRYHLALFSSAGRGDLAAIARFRGVLSMFIVG
jgi:hypothetical protein